MYHVFRIGCIKRQDGIDICFHLYTADQHEIQNEDQYEQIDDKAADPSHYGLPDAGKGGYDKRGRITAQYVIACFTFDDSGYFFDRSNDGLRIEIEVLQFVDQHPYYQ